MIPFLELGAFPPAVLLPWLTHKGSLTAKLRETTGDGRVVLLDEKWGYGGWWGKYAANIEFREAVWQREVLITAHTRPCWYARSLIPAETWQANALLFQRLQQESLGEIIFNDALIQRISLVHYAIGSHCMEYYWLPMGLRRHSDLYWARYSVFLVNNLPFFLTEIFLKDLDTFIEK